MSILFLGNSFTFNHDLPEMVAEISKAEVKVTYAEVLITHSEAFSCVVNALSEMIRAAGGTSSCMKPGLMMRTSIRWLQQEWHCSKCSRGCRQDAVLWQR